MKYTQYERDKMIYEMRRKQGRTLQEIGDIFNLTRERIRQIVEKIDRTLDK